MLTRVLKEHGPQWLGSQQIQMFHAAHLSTQSLALQQLGQSLVVTVSSQRAGSSCV